MMFAGLALILVCWSWQVLRDRPVREYGVIYVITAALGCLTECSTLGIWNPFEIHMHLLRDPYRDLFATEILVKMLLFPLIACLYVRYAGKHPFRVAAGAALALGLLERAFLATGEMKYHGWHTWITALLFFGLFMLLLWVVRHPIPLWLDTGSVAFAAAYISHQLARVMMLWTYQLPMPIWRTDSLFLVGQNLLIAGPSALAVTMVERLRNPAGIIGMVGLNLLANQWLRLRGILVYTGWNVWAGGLRYLAIAGITLAYFRWQTEERTGAVVLHP